MDADHLLAEFEQSLGGRDPKTIAAYLTHLTHPHKMMLRALE